MCFGLGFDSFGCLFGCLGFVSGVVAWCCLLLCYFGVVSVITMYD